ncbi:DoxX family protein [Paenibacillus chitinolyticus]|uniref:DoxX family protein n=1 Tax=Paenibacillus chitinolyticus TaxID=79263 RepID=UPI003663B054
MVQHWNEYRYPFWFMYVVATLEIIGGIGVLTGFWYFELSKYIAALIAVLMLGTIHAHLFRAKHNPYGDKCNVDVVLIHFASQHSNFSPSLMVGFPSNDL